MTLFLLLACQGTEPTGPAASTGDSGSAPDPIVVVTFNTGTTLGLDHDAGDDGYTSADAATSDAWYGDGLAWPPAIDAATAFFAELQPDIVGFQEIFHPEDCLVIPEKAHAGFVCQTWRPGDPTVAQRLLGPDYQVACHLGKTDKCVGVRRAFGTFVGCDGDLCLDGLDGASVDGCGSGSRIGRGTIARPDGSTLTVVHVHGNSGVGEEEKACRAQQVEQVFLDLDGEPGANGPANVVLGDLNTDPGRWTGFDRSAQRWVELTTEPFRWVTEMGPDAPLTYQGVATIDHVLSDAYTGGCWHPGFTEGHPAVIDAVYFDHSPAVCTLYPSTP